MQKISSGWIPIEGKDFSDNLIITEGNSAMAEVSNTVAAIDPLSAATLHLHLAYVGGSADPNGAPVVGLGTGSVFERNGAHFIVTARHNFTGRHNDSGECLSTSKAVPDVVRINFRPRGGRIMDLCPEQLPLYVDEQMHEPLWYEHPKFGHFVDVVALPLPARFVDDYQLLPINSFGFDTAFDVRVADDAFVIGYPFPETPPFGFPIWKRATVASEPRVDVDKLPKMLIDTATRPGLSGSPVIMQRIGLHGMTGNIVTGAEIIGQIRNFIGIYSGRVDGHTDKAQLGIVWKAHVINEIIDASKRGTRPALT